MDEFVYNLLDLFVFSQIESFVCFSFYLKIYNLKISKFKFFINVLFLGFLTYFASEISNDIILYKQIFLITFYYMYFLLFTKCNFLTSSLFSFGYIGYTYIKELFMLLLFNLVFGLVNFTIFYSVIIFFISKIFDIILIRMISFEDFCWRRNSSIMN